MKGYLAWHDRPFRKTRNLVEIGQQVADLDPELEPLLRRAAALTEYAWKFRYPGEPEEPTQQEEPVVITKNGRIEAFLLPCDEDEFTDLMLQYSPSFRKMIDRAAASRGRIPPSNVKKRLGKRRV